jgi:hypothetical protein
MATAYTEKQSAGTASTATYANLLTTGATETAVIASITLCNETASAITVRCGVSPTNGTTAPATGKFLLYDTSVPPGSPIVVSGAWSLSASKYLNISSSAAGISFTAAVAIMTP